MKVIALLGLAAGLAGCTSSGGHRTTDISLRSVTISPRVFEVKPIFQPDAVKRPDLGAPVGDVVRREFYMVLRRSRYFPEVTGAVPVAPRDSDLDVQPLRTSGAAASPAEGIFHLTVMDWEFGHILGTGKMQPKLSLFAVLTDRHGRELARGQATTAMAELPRRPMADYIGHPRTAGIDLGIAAEVVSRRLLDAMLAPKNR